MQHFKIGLEVEFYDTPFVTVHRNVEKLNALIDSNWLVKEEKTSQFTKDNILFGGEINSPVLRYSNDHFEEISSICRMLKEENVNVSDKCSTHFHFDVEYFKQDSRWVDLIELWLAYEHIIYRFGFDKKILGRDGVWDYARPLSIYKENYLKFIDFVKEGNLSVFDVKNSPSLKDRDLFFKQSGLNLSNVIYDVEYYEKNKTTLQEKIPTVEVRCFDSTIDDEKILSSIDMFGRIFKKINTGQIDIEKMRYINNNPSKLIRNRDNINYFRQLFCDDAVEFSNIVFDDYNEKVKFLKHYIK